MGSISPPTLTVKTLDAQAAKVLLKQFQADPKLPVSNPTASVWQEKLHPLYNVQSPELPERTEYAIIGSGVTGCSVAKTLLEDPRSGSDRVTILEARTLCSSATGRNGGHLVSPIPGEFVKYVSAVGLEMAIKIARFNNATLEKMHKLAAESDDATRKTAEVRRTISVIAFTDQHLFDESKESIELYMQHVPEGRGLYKAIDAEEAKKVYGFTDCVGAVEEPSGAFWPYRLITGTFGDLTTKFESRFSIETHTPVSAITSDGDEEYPFILETPRGHIAAKHVIHCTNGHASHLLPKLRGFIYPLRGTMSVQAPKNDFPRLGHRLSWALQKNSTYDSSKGVVEPGLYYATQNANTGDMFIGGEKSNIFETITSDDSIICDTAKENIEHILPQVFGKYDNGAVKGVWSGILAFTVDFSPLVGQLPDFVTDHTSQSKASGQQWIAAGFNGYGMPQCWGAGEAVAKLILGGDEGRDEVFEWLPDIFEVTKERFKFDEGPQSGLKSYAELLGLSLDVNYTT